MSSVQLCKDESVSSQCEACFLGPLGFLLVYFCRVYCPDEQYYQVILVIECFPHRNMSSFFLNLHTHKLTHTMAKEVGEHCLLVCTVIQKKQCRGEVMCFCSLKISNQANQREARCHLRHNQVLLALADTICAGISHSKQHHPAKVVIILVHPCP